MSELNVNLVAADGEVWQGEADEVVVPAEEGPMGILPRHAPILAALGEGEVRIKSSSGTFTADCEGGFVTVDQNVVTIAVDNAKVSSGK